MAVGKLRCTVNLTEIPENWSLEVTEFTPNATGDWYAENEMKAPPYSVAKGKTITECILSTTDVTDHGAGPSAKVLFTVTDVKGNKNKGFLVMSSTPWGYTSRPDYLTLTFGLVGEAPLAPIYLDVPTLITPDPFSVGFSQKDEQILMVGSSDKTVSTEVMSDILDGIITAHTKVLAWIIG